ncbi:glycosyl transferase [Tengunoibacter tsumagoiensis]|uniref:4,4'-diaponeurosporenoate glycosyltransferase n=1 Tax=Tengunoibacter tsumagoiensis TaxID=2014871 RepID=A0A402A5E8_9CHLR|nr:glycosyl transferase [Tengunoibacter tsumagoiensis]
MGSEELPFISIIVPARNEERNIERCVTSLLEQDYPGYEVIVVDDGSTDRTSELLDQIQQNHPQGGQLWILRLRDELPVGWAGKPHALHSGVLEASGSWLLFTDADTYHTPSALRSALTQAVTERMDLFTLATTQELPTFWERVLMPMAFMGISMLYPPRQVNDPASPTAIANGQFFLVRRAVYDAVGGYARPELRQTLLDDRDLARVIKDHGYRLHFVDGQDAVSVRMYTSLEETWRGWRKNSYLGNRGGLLFVCAQLIGLPMITFSPFLLPFLGKGLEKVLGGHLTAKERWFATGIELTPLLAYRIWINRQLAVPWYYALTHPIAGLVFTGIMGQSTWNILTGKGVDWRGRRYHQIEASNEPLHEKSQPAV